MAGGVPAGVQHAVGDVGEREVGHGVAAGLVQQYDVFAVGNPRAAGGLGTETELRHVLNVREALQAVVRGQQPPDVLGRPWKAC
jgi:hypothetical protein